MSGSQVWQTNKTRRDKKTKNGKHDTDLEIYAGKNRYQ